MTVTLLRVLEEEEEKKKSVHRPWPLIYLETCNIYLGITVYNKFHYYNLIIL